MSLSLRFTLLTLCFSFGIILSIFSDCWPSLAQFSLSQGMEGLDGLDSATGKLFLGYMRASLQRRCGGEFAEPFEAPSLH